MTTTQLKKVALTDLCTILGTIALALNLPSVYARPPRYCQGGSIEETGRNRDRGRGFWLTNKITNSQTQTTYFQSSISLVPRHFLPFPRNKAFVSTSKAFLANTNRRIIAWSLHKFLQSKPTFVTHACIPLFRQCPCYPQRALLNAERTDKVHNVHTLPYRMGFTLSCLLLFIIIYNDQLSFRVNLKVRHTFSLSFGVSGVGGWGQWTKTACDKTRSWQHNDARSLSTLWAAVGSRKLMGSSSAPSCSQALPRFCLFPPWASFKKTKCSPGWCKSSYSQRILHSDYNH